MEFPPNANKTTSPKKPLVVINKNNIIKAGSLVFLKSPTKRHSSVQNAQQMISSSAKRKCTEPIQGTQSLAKPLTSANKTEPETENTSKEISIISNVQIKTEFDIELHEVQDKSNERQNKEQNMNAKNKGIGRTGKHPSMKCLKHKDLPEHDAEGLVKPGDVFLSIQDFSKYAAAQAKHWYFYYAIVSSRNPKLNGSKYKKDKATIYTFACRFRKKAESQSKGIRNRNDVNRELNCQASVVLRYKRGEEGYKVTHACHHHNHDLSLEMFMKLPHGHRLPPELKDEIDDLASLEVAGKLIRQYVRSKTGWDLGKMVNNRIAKIRRSKKPREIAPDKMKEVLAKIKHIKATFQQELPQKSRGVKINKPKREIKVNNKTTKPRICLRPQKQDPEYCDEVVITTSERIEPCDRDVTNFVELENSEVGELQVIPWEETVQSGVGDDVMYEVEGDVPEAETDYVIRTMSVSNETTISPTSPNDQVIMEGYKIVPISALRNKPKLSNASKEKIYQNLIRIETVACGVPHTLGKVKEPKSCQNPLNDLNSGTNTGDSCQELETTEVHEMLITNDPKHNLHQPNESECVESHKDLPVFTAEDSVDVGDMFESLDVFEKYAAMHAKQWGFKYTYAEARSGDSNENGVATAIFRCTAYLKQICKDLVPCPASVALRQLPNESEYTVKYACHHHNHSPSGRGKRGGGLSPGLKNEIRDLAWLGLDGQIIRRHIYFETGIDLIQSIKNIINKINKETKREMSQKKVDEIFDKIKRLEKKYGPIVNTWHRDKQKIDADRKKFLENHESVQRRVETRINNKQYNENLIRNVEELQMATGCDIQLQERVASGEIENDYATMQLQSVEDTGYYENDNDEVEVDQELYAVDENIEYILSAQHENETVYEMDISTSENVYSQEDESVKDRNDEPNEIIYYEAVEECTDDENEFEQRIDDNAGTIRTCHENGEATKDMAVQVDFELLELDSDYEAIKKMEMAAISEDLSSSKHISNTRGQPKHFLEERIINRFNIELYIALGGVVSCLENLADSMKISVLHLLKQLYQGECVFKLAFGRSGQQKRKTVQLTYVPLTITFPYEKYRYTNGLQEYKTMCSKYLDMTMKLEKVVEELSAKLTAAEVRWKDLQSFTKKISEQRQADENDLLEAKIKVKQLECTNEQHSNTIEQLCKKIKDLDNLLKEKETNKQINVLNKKLDESRHQNCMLQIQIKKLEEIENKNFEIHNENVNLKSTLDSIKTDKNVIESVLRETEKVNCDLKKKLKFLDDENLEKHKLTEKIRVLERDLKSSNALICKLKQVQGPA